MNVSVSAPGELTHGERDASGPSPGGLPGPMHARFDTAEWVPGNDAARTAAPRGIPPASHSSAAGDMCRVVRPGGLERAMPDRCAAGGSYRGETRPSQD